MLRFLKSFLKIDLIKKIGVLEKENKQLKDQNVELKFGEYVDDKDPRVFIESILKRKIDWYDYKKLDDNAWRTYFNEAGDIFRNEVFNNELHHYMSDLIKFAATETKDFDQVLHTRAGIIVLESFKNRFEDIESPDRPKGPPEEPFSSL